LIVAAFTYYRAPDDTRILLRRFFSPGEKIVMTYVTSLTGDQLTAKGEPLLLKAEVSGRRQREAALEIRGADGEQTSTLLLLSDESPQTCEYKIPSVKGSFKYSLRSGDGSTPVHSITALERPNIAEVKFKITPPAYSRLPVDEPLREADSRSVFCPRNR
jgi:hypothetical protein